MKKIVLSAAVLFAAFAAQAQTPSTSQADQSLQSDASTLTVTLDLDNVLTMSPNNATAYQHFQNASDYNTGMDVNYGASNGGGNNTFTVQSNRRFNVTAYTVTNFTWSGTGSAPVNSTMPSSILKIRIENPTLNLGTGYTIPSGVLNSGPLGGVAISTTAGTPTALINSAQWGGNRTFSVDFSANPGWEYAGGRYTLPVTVTASQL
jgi:hypothetical protein